MTLLEQLSDKIAGILYFSESEYPLTIEQWGPLPATEVAHKIAAIHNVDQHVVKPVDASEFFAQIERSADPNDTPIVENAQRFKALHQFLNDHLASIQVHRVENGTTIPVYITGNQPEGACIALATTAIES
ncbi:nuclease A inhibitor family protein [Chitinophaga vietnamensis]|uniref:nuclease A inhibitor family protein n=1 Tax=Chitinophaga vietnamensis TaxID=2593957 RepID=UPI0011776D7D|nr:nuclease A inhibitor family protein [Chitinophaga vietnamensis]